MLIQEYQSLGTKRVLASVINYANEEEIVLFAQHLAKQTAAQDLLLAVTVNKWTDGKRQWLLDALNGIDMDIMLCDPEKNLGAPPIACSSPSYLKR